MSRILFIEKHLDAILNQKKWTKREIDLYQMLQKKISQYEHKIPTFELVQDKEDIVTNIQEQSWYIASKYKNVINTLLNEMDIDSYEFFPNNGNIVSNLEVNFPKSKFKLKAYYSIQFITDDEYQVQYYIFLEDFDQVKRAYIAYNDLDDVHQLGNIGKLPQLNEIIQIIKAGSYVSKVELIKFFTEIILYYDESGYVAQTHIAQHIPITISNFLTLQPR